MNRDFIQWLSTQRLPLFDISRAYGVYTVVQRHPPKTVAFECELDELLPLIQEHFPQLRSPVGELAVKTAIEDLRLEPWWRSAGPITEEIRFLLREGFKSLHLYVKSTRKV